MCENIDSLCFVLKRSFFIPFDSNIKKNIVFKCFFFIPQKIRLVNSKKKTRNKKIKTKKKVFLTTTIDMDSIEKDEKYQEMTQSWNRLLFYWLEITTCYLSAHYNPSEGIAANLDLGTRKRLGNELEDIEYRWNNHYKNIILTNNISFDFDSTEFPDVSALQKQQ